MSEKYVSTSVGFLTPSDVKEGDKLLIVEDAHKTLSEKNQTDYWNAKVKLPKGGFRLAGLMDTSCVEFVKAFGEMTGDWTGHTVVVNLKTSKAGNPYILLYPSDEAKVKIEQPEVPPIEEGVPYPDESNDVAF